MNKSNLILASVLAVIFTSVLIIFSLTSKKTSPSSPTPSPILTESISPTHSVNIPEIPNGWKTYSSTAYGISFSYPEDWRVEETADYLRVRQINPEGVLIIGIDFKKTVLSIEELLSNFEKTDSVFKQINPNIKPEKIIINGIDGYKIEYTVATGLEKISIIVSNNLHKILIEHRFPSDNTMNQILSTFKFINLVPVTNNWIQRSNGDFQTNSNCLWLATTKANDNGDLEEYLKRFYQTNSLTSFLNQKVYSIKNLETITISSQGVGELFSVYFQKNEKTYSISFGVTSQDGLETKQCQNYQDDINFVLNNVDLFL